MKPSWKRLLKGSALAICAAFVGIQFIRPPRNDGDPEGPRSIVATHPVPGNVRAILQRSCYDCHSDRTSYPWYAEVQPVRWWLESHIREGKEHLNFSAFGSYGARRSIRALDEIVDTVLARSMPLKSYTWVHRDAVLTKAEIDAVADWAEGLIDGISGH